MFKSTDGGSTWTATSADLPPLPVNGMAVDSTGAVFVGNDAGIFRSRDGGASWTMLPLWMPVSALAIDPGSNVLYAGAPDWYPAGVFTSADGGDTWNDTEFFGTTSRASRSASRSSTQARRMACSRIVGSGSWTPASGGIQESVTSVAVSSANPDFAYAGTNSALFITADGGNTWSARLPYPVMSVTIAPSNPSVAYVATWYGSGMTEDGGMLWLRHRTSGNQSWLLRHRSARPQPRLRRGQRRLGLVRVAHQRGVGRTSNTRRSSVVGAPNGAPIFPSIPAAPPMSRGLRNPLTFPSSMPSSRTPAV